MRSAQLSCLILVLLSCSGDAEQAYVGTFAVCVGAGEAVTLWTAADGAFHWTHDGCDYFPSGTGRWTRRADGSIELASSGSQGSWLVGIQTISAVAVDGGLLLAEARETEKLWQRGGLCSSCRVN